MMLLEAWSRLDMSVTRELSEFALGIRYEDIPAHVIA